MRKFLAALAVSVFLSVTALANHLEPPFPGQERNEDVFLCLQNLEAARMMTQSQKFRDNGQSASVFIDHINALVSADKCQYLNIRYEVVEIVESRDGPIVNERKEWGENKTQYVLKIKGQHSDKTYYIATF